MNLNEYQELARKTAVYPKIYSVIYPALGLAGETGETVEKIKKAVRAGSEDFMDTIDRAGVIKEMGDVLWYLANLASDLGVSLDAIATLNIEKLAKRQTQSTIVGEGDNR